MHANTKTVRIHTPKIQSRDYRFNYEVYDSPAEFVRITQSRAFDDKHGDGDMLARTDLDTGWYGVGSSQEALDLCANGWGAKMRQVTAMTREAKRRIPASRSRMVNDVCGFAPVVPLALAGCPMSMISTVQVPRKSRTIDLYYDMTLSCTLPSSRLMSMGMGICEAVMRLEASGYRVRLSMMQSYADYKDGDHLIIRIKDETQPFNLERMCFPLFNPAMFRVLGFAWEDRCPTAVHRWGRGIGLGYKYGKEALRQISEGVFGPNAIIVFASKLHDQGMDRDRATLADAMERELTNCGTEEADE